MYPPCACTQPHIVGVTMHLVPIDTTVCLVVQIICVRYIPSTPTLEEV